MVMMYIALMMVLGTEIVYVPFVGMDGVVVDTTVSPVFRRTMVTCNGPLGELGA